MACCLKAPSHYQCSRKAIGSSDIADDFEKSLIKIIRQIVWSSENLFINLNWNIWWYFQSVWWFAQNPVFMKIIGHFWWLGPNVWWEISQIWIKYIKPIGQIDVTDESWKFFGYTDNQTNCLMCRKTFQVHCITWTNVDLSSVTSIDIHLRSISQDMLINLTRNKYSKITILKLLSFLCVDESLKVDTCIMFQVMWSCLLCYECLWWSVIVQKKYWRKSMGLSHTEDGTDLRRNMNMETFMFELCTCVRLKG